ncbi:hypothetical protein AK830_g4232 [Neonectria ditissima]|uniref:Zn(2)-C6 fungal-type domain-containing protein n=1 Tax=Neonectria ditissima TaxID=78410 RepID=A0A0P7BLY0_9HYPO|nr:hypothetical protein AK830_g4232 [Neonectria ditissima]
MTRKARLASATQVMTSPPKARQQENRRAHTKSRTGCLVCKRRRVKCDEGRPRCRKCTVGDRSCSYTSDVNPGLSTRRPGTLLGSSPSAPSVLAGSDLASLSFRDGFTALHMVLLHHATTSMAGYMALEGDMHPIISEATFIPSFLFASLMGIHVLHNTLAADQHTAGSFVHSFVDYMRIHRGVRTVTSRYWQDLLCSDLKPLLYVTLWIDEVEPSVPKSARAAYQVRPAKACATSSVEGSKPESRWIMKREFANGMQDEASQRYNNSHELLNTTEADERRSNRYLIEKEKTSPDHVIVGGESTGGHLDVACLLGIAREGLPRSAASILLCPWVNLTNTGASLNAIKTSIQPTSNDWMPQQCWS